MTALKWRVIQRVGAMVLCSRFGLDEEARQQWLELLQLSEGDQELLNDLVTQVISPNVDAIVAEFYRHLQKQAVARQLLGRLDSLAGLQQTQRNYLITLGQDFTSDFYFENRLRVGLAHARIGMPLSLYQGAYTLLQRLIIKQIERCVAPARRALLVDTMLRITALDMSLAIQAYHNVRVADLGEVEALEAQSV